MAQSRLTLAGNRKRGFCDRINVVEGDDGTGGTKWRWEFSNLRKGIADIPQIVQDFKDVGYSGYLSLEDFGPGDDGTKLREQTACLRQLIAG